MTPVTDATTVADLLEYLGDISPRRVLLKPAPGTATEADLVRVLRRKDRLVELVAGTLVEKAMGYREANLAGWILRLLADFADANNLGEVTPGDGPLRLLAGLVRVPDVSFIRRD